MKNFDSVFNEQALKQDADWVMKRKHELFRKLKEMPMPRERDEEWRYTEIEKIDVSGTELSDFQPKLTESDVIFMDMKTAIRKHPELVKKYFLLDGAKEDKVSIASKIFWTNGVFIYVPKGIDAGILSSKVILDKDTMSYTLIVLEEGASVRYFEETTGNAGLMTDATDVYVGRNASLDFYVMQNTGDSKIFSNKNAFIDKDGRLQWVAGCFGGKLARLKIDNHFREPGASAETNSFFVGSGTQHIDITTNAIHIAPNTTNNISNKGILRQDASSVYRGMIKIGKEAQKTISYLSDNTIMLGEKALANSIPGLMIDANDVKASHGSTIGQIDEHQLFYLRSRGLTREQAEKLIIEGFIEPSIEMIKDEDLRDEYRKAVEAKAA
ncbi:MAG: Fe-S cluster assembly protein SufD [Candidatus Aenigmarchaeota archaeon]|nr:Fe-S cluster assembly protein SufD [Candidatus Aenigmarchaeota archaeon]